MPRTHILPEPLGREQAGASEATTAAEAARAAAAVAAEASGARAAAAKATAAAKRSRRCRWRLPHRPRRGSRPRVAAPLAQAPGQSAASPELTAENEGTTGDSEHPKSLASSPTSHSRHHVMVAELGWGWRAGKAGTVFPRPHPFLSPSSPAPARPQDRDARGRRRM